MTTMLRARPDGVRREWFVDARDGGRRMELSWHAGERLVIVSLWNGDVCRATFRLPVERAPEVIHVLAGALGDAAGTVPAASDTVARPSLVRRTAAALQRVRMRLDPLDKKAADVVDLATHRGRRS